VRAVCLPDAGWREISAKMEDTMRSVLGEEIKVASERCEMIQPGPSGKVRVVISRLKQQGNARASD